MDMSSSYPVRSDPLTDWLQPSNENLVDDEEHRVARVEENEDMQDTDQEREGVVDKEKEELDSCLSPGFPVGGRFRNTN